MSWRTALRWARWALPAVFLGLAVRMGYAAFHIPLEAGGILFTPMLLGAAALTAGVAVALVVPWRRSKGGGLGFWAALADLFSPF